ncbi:methyl-CpG-binding domain-containing protein 2-like [Phalaenopsis equestris]|uniref:methyl-CpG-binding domain-containing protein 2-like n=1 Tax=Phalaenopsis equestris TaxID=78828 RepID=UPI0009E59DFB|nr:methyl-CpG-binding domain-containing protein 2-like [Phalaenopsis equestris]
MVEIQRYLEENPEYVERGVNVSQFSFQIPKPLQENYVKKRNARLLNASDGSGLGLSGLPEPVEAFPLSWAAPPTQQEAETEEPEPASDLPSSESLPHTRKRIAKEQVRRPSSKKMCASPQDIQ